MNVADSLEARKLRKQRIENGEKYNIMVTGAPNSETLQSAFTTLLCDTNTTTCKVTVNKIPCTVNFCPIDK